MNDYSRLLKDILKTSRWTQSQLAARLGVSFATVNSWINKKSQPRDSMAKKIQELYMARDITQSNIPVYLTILNIDSSIRVDDIVSIEKFPDNNYDDEYLAILSLDGSSTQMYVANSPDNIVRGTWSAGRIYDKIMGIARAQVKFIAHDFAIAQVISWDIEN